jgi:hypothetical protein
MIDQSLAAAARKAIAEIAGEKWSRVEAEIQDGGTFLFFMAWIEWGEPKEVGPVIKSALVKTLNGMIPSDATQTLGSWSVSVYYGAALVDAIFPDDV